MLWIGICVHTLVLRSDWHLELFIPVPEATSTPTPALLLYVMFVIKSESAYRVALAW